MQRFDIVVNGAQPRIHFFLFGAGQETVLFRQRRRRAGGNDLVEAALFHRHLDRRRQRQNGFTGTGGTGQGDHMDIRIQQQMQSDGLMNIDRLQSPGMLLHQRRALQMQDGHHALLDRANPANKPLLINQVLVRKNFLTENFTDQQAVGNAVHGIAAFLNRLDLINPVPETAFNIEVTTGHLTNVAEQLIGVVILGINTTGP